MKFDFITIFPHILDSYVNESILKRAQEKGCAEFDFHDLRDYTTDRHKTVDDTPYGGGPGMIFKIEPMYAALIGLIGKEALLRRVKKEPVRDSVRDKNAHIVIMSPNGALFTQEKAQELSTFDRLIFICGRYEGIDARVDFLSDRHISIGPYVLSGGELPAMVVAEAVTRLLPGVLGSADSLAVESYNQVGGAVERAEEATEGSTTGTEKKNTTKIEEKTGKHAIEYPQYTRPEVFEPVFGVSWKVPEVLLSGDHEKIAAWRSKEMKQR